MPVIFQDRSDAYVADTCEGLKESSVRGDLNVKAWSHAPYPGLQVEESFIPELRTIGFWDADQAQGWGLERHCNEGIEISYLANGQLPFAVDGQSWDLKSGQVAMTRPWQFHQIGNPNIPPSRLYWLILDVNVRRPNHPWKWPDWLVLSARELKRLTELLSHNEHPVWDATPRFARIYRKLIQCIEEGNPADEETQVKIHINELLLSLLKMLEDKHMELNTRLSSSERVVEMFLQAVKGHLSRKWTLEGMAAQCGLSRSQFSIYCRQLTNLTPVQYLGQCRMEEARRMLKEAPPSPSPYDMTISEIAAACGFSSSQYFSTTFQRSYGCSPSEFRRRNVT